VGRGSTGQSRSRAETWKGIGPGSCSSVAEDAAETLSTSATNSTKGRLERAVVAKPPRSAGKASDGTASRRAGSEHPTEPAELANADAWSAYTVSPPIRESAKLCGVEPGAYLRESTLRAVRNPGTATLPSDLRSPESRETG
jgi:hypothetical protein